MKLFSYVMAAGLLTVSSAAVADSCLMRLEKSDPAQIQCQEYGPAFQEATGSGQTMGQIGCEGIRDIELTENGKTIQTEFRKGEKCPTKNLELRCGIAKVDGEFGIVMYIYKGVEATQSARERCKSMQGEVL